jgi:hypothetical protein
VSKLNPTGFGLLWVYSLIFVGFQTSFGRCLEPSNFFRELIVTHLGWIVLMHITESIRKDSEEKQTRSACYIFSSLKSEMIRIAYDASNLRDSLKKTMHTPCKREVTVG